jgi:transposase
MMNSTIIGIDTHANKNQIFAINKNSGEATEATLPGEAAYVVDWVKEQGFEEPITCVYESGPTGYILARSLKQANISCSIAAVSKLPKRKDKKKNDREDAKNVARAYLAGQVSEVFIPDEEQQALRSLAALRGEAAKDLTRAKQRVTSFLLLCGVRYTEGKKRWTKMFIKWATSYEFPCAVDTFTLRDKLAEVLRLTLRLEAIENEIARTVALYPHVEEMMTRLKCIHGIGPVTGFAVVSYAIDFHRFKSGSAFAASLGLMPSESSTGDKTSRGKITKQGNSHVRRLLMEAACSYSKPFKVQNAAGLNPAVDPLIRQKAAQCSERLRKRRRHLSKRGKNPNKIKCAIARELCEWIYYLAVM